VAQLPESGRGLAIMRAFVDHVTLDSSPGRGTVVTLRKHIRWSTDAPLRRFRAASLRPSEPKGRGAVWTEERRRSDEGRQGLKGRPEASGT